MIIRRPTTTTPMEPTTSTMVEGVYENKGGALKRKAHDQFGAYLGRVFPDDAAYFKAWDIEGIINDRPQWHLKASWINLYVCAKINSANTCTNVDIGCTEVLYKRLAERRTKQTTRCQLLIVVPLPPYRNFTADSLKTQCKIPRGWKLKCEKALEISLKLRLTFKISRDLLDPDSSLYSPGVSRLLHAHIDAPDIKHFLLETSGVNEEM